MVDSKSVSYPPAPGSPGSENYHCIVSESATESHGRFNTFDAEATKFTRKNCSEVLDVYTTALAKQIELQDGCETHHLNAKMWTRKLKTANPLCDAVLITEAWMCEKQGSI